MDLVRLATMNCWYSDKILYVRVYHFENLAREKLRKFGMQLGLLFIAWASKAVVLKLNVYCNFAASNFISSSNFWRCNFDAKSSSRLTLLLSDLWMSSIAKFKADRQASYLLNLTFYLAARVFDAFPFFIVASCISFPCPGSRWFYLAKFLPSVQWLGDFDSLEPPLRPHEFLHSMFSIHGLKPCLYSCHVRGLDE